jgi:hypothetical protein
MSADDIFARRAIVNRELKKLKDRVTELEASGSKSNAKEVAKLTRKVEDLEGRFVASGPTDAVLQELQRLDTSTKNIYLRVGDHGDRIRDLEQSEAQRISFKDSEIDVAHQGEIESRTPWGEAVMWGLVGALAGWLIFVVALDVKNGWIGAVAGFGVALFTAAHLLQRHYLKLAIQARHKWAYKDDQPPPTAALPAADATTDANWWDDQQVDATKGDAS